MSYRLVDLDERPGVRPVGIGEKLCQALSKLVMRAAGNQAKMAYGNQQLCAGIESGMGCNTCISTEENGEVGEK